MGSAPHSPDAGSEGADAHTAPSEFLAEFLSAIMRRQYKEALKFCRLILQYEPHNATARGFYPLLRHKLAAPAPAPAHPAHPHPTHALNTQHEVCVGGCSGAGAGACMEEGADEEAEGEECEWAGSERSSASQSSLSLDTTTEEPRSSPSVSPARPTTASHTHSPSPHKHSGSASASSGLSACWASTGSGAPSSERTDADDNGNALPATDTTARPLPEDVENENACGGCEVGGGGVSAREAASLQRLRAQFACSIK